MVGVAFGAGSFVLRDRDPWTSNLLANAAVVVILLIPGEMLLSRVREEVARVESVTDSVRITAENAQATADEAARSLAEIRDVILTQQQDELQRHLDTYRDIARNPTRETFLTALRRATADGVISREGVRSPVWSTDLHYRFVVDGPGGELVIQLEHDDGTVISAQEWQVGMDPQVMMQFLVGAVRSAGADLGTGLNDPTESVERLSEMLVEVTQLRAQELMGHRQTLQGIIERIDGWYFTEQAVIPANNLHYVIAVNRLDEPDWEEHLRAKGWYGAPIALEFARRLYGRQFRNEPPERP
jgi:outer membrane murein-binding lipoprotein Lpp